MKSYCILLISVQLLQGIWIQCTIVCCLISDENKMKIFILVAVYRGIMNFFNCKELTAIKLVVNSRLFN